MRLTTRTRYGTRAMLDLALHDGQRPVTSKGIAERQGLPVKYLEHLLADLGRAGLVRTVRGPRGGHMLARRPEEISLREIYEALEGTDGLVECIARPEVCDRHDECVTREIWGQMEAACMGILESTRLGDLVRRAREKQSASARA